MSEQDILVNAKFEALIQQRTIAENAYVNLAGEHAVLQAKCKELQDRLDALQVDPGHDDSGGSETQG